MKWLLSLSARLMARQAINSQRDRVKAKARQLRSEMGLPELEALR